MFYVGAILVEAKGMGSYLDLPEGTTSHVVAH